MYSNTCPPERWEHLILYSNTNLQLKEVILIVTNLKFDVIVFIGSYSTTHQAIRRTIDKKTVDVYQKFNEELNLVKKEFNTKTPNLTPTQPKFAGAAAWARALKRRVDRPMDVS